MILRFVGAAILLAILAGCATTPPGPATLSFVPPPTGELNQGTELPVGVFVCRTQKDLETMRAQDPGKEWSQEVEKLSVFRSVFRGGYSAPNVTVPNIQPKISSVVILADFVQPRRGIDSERIVISEMRPLKTYWVQLYEDDMALVER